MKLLADTSALLALYAKDDARHGDAKRFLVASPRARFVLSELVVAELATRLRARLGAERAVAVTADLLRSRRYEVLFIDSALLELAFEKMAQHADRRLSLADCASFALIERLGLDGAFTFDRDFRDCGFRALP